MNGAGGRRIVVAGAGLAGLRTAERLRAAGWSEAITVVGAEPHLPYNRPPLTKEALRDGPAATQVELRRRGSVGDVEWRLGHAVDGVDLDGRRVRLEDGTSLAYDGLVVATGVSPRRVVSSSAGEPLVLRTLEHASSLHTALRPGARVVVVGAGFVGCEVAASATALGAEVTVVDPGATPLELQVGTELGGEVRRRHEAHGTRFRLGRTVDEVRPGTDGTQLVRLDDGSDVTADVVVEAVGSRPNVALLEGQGLDLSDGVLCDQDLHPVRGGAARLDVVVVGDVARVPLAGFGGAPRRVEHWSMAVDTAAHAAPSLVAGLAGRASRQPFTAVPAFWSEQHGVRLQSFGLPAAGRGDVRLLEGDLASEAVLGFHDEEGLVGVVLVGLASRMMEFRDLLVGQLALRSPLLARTS